MWTLSDQHNLVQAEIARLPRQYALTRDTDICRYIKANERRVIMTALLLHLSLTLTHCAAKSDVGWHQLQFTVRGEIKRLC